jgi:hypothetical protein
VAWRFLGPVIGVALILVVGYFLLPKYSTGEKEDYDLWRAKQLTVACENYKIDHDEWPPNLEALIQPRAEEKPPYVEFTTLQSATGGLYQYDPAGSHHNGLKPDIWVDTPRGPIGNWMSKVPR